MSDNTIREIFDIIVNMEVVKQKGPVPEMDENDPVAAIVDALNVVTVALEEQNDEIVALKQSNTDLLHSFQDVARYKSALDISSIVSISDDEGKIIYANDLFCEVSGYSQDELKGAKHSILSSGYHKKMFWNGMWQIISQGNIWNNEIMNVDKEGIGFWLDTTIVPFFNSDGDVVNYLAMSHDITKRKNQESEAIEHQHHVERLNTNLEQFAHTVSHDLKSPLNNANGLVSIIESTLGDGVDPEVKQYIDLLKETNGKMRGLIDGILQYAKASGKNVDLEKISLKQFIIEVGDTMTAKGQAKLVFANELPTVTYNNTVLKQVLSNLMSNAIKFCDKDDCIISFSSMDDNHYYHISVADNGPGVDKIHQEDMFKLFNKVNTNKNIDSSGVGLATVKKIVNEAGGNIWVESELGFGTTFTFTIRKKPKK